MGALWSNAHCVAAVPISANLRRGVPQQAESEKDAGRHRSVGCQNIGCNPVNGALKSAGTDFNHFSAEIRASPSSVRPSSQAVNAVLQPPQRVTINRKPFKLALMRGARTGKEGAVQITPIAVGRAIG
jgi:hypothetical protein